jgi:hypothetical protein
MSDVFSRRYFVSRRSLAVALACSLTLGASAPVLAAAPNHRSASQVVFNKSSKNGSLYVASGLLPGHKYAIKVSAKHHAQFTTTGFQNFVYVVSKHPIEDSRPLALKGKAPYSHILKQPVSQKLREWMMVMTVNLMSREKITVKVLDLGKA